MNDKRHTIDIVCGIDARYAPHLAAMLVSMLEPNKDNNLRIHVLHDGVDRDTQALVASCTHPIEVRWIEITNHKVLKFDGLLQITRATYLRLIMLEVLDQTIDKALYLDVDMIVEADLLPLWKTNLEDHLAAAVIDPGIDPIKFAEKWSLELPGKYFNAGVILFNLAKLKTTKLFDDAIAILEDPHKHCEFADQDALNIVLWNRWLELELAWNVQRKFLYNNLSLWRMAYPKMDRKPAIIHFTEQQKPWLATEWHPYAFSYIKNLWKTPFKFTVAKQGNIDFKTRLKWRIKYWLKRL